MRPGLFLLSLFMAPVLYAQSGGPAPVRLYVGVGGAYVKDTFGPFIGAEGGFNVGRHLLLGQATGALGKPCCDDYVFESTGAFALLYGRVVELPSGEGVLELAAGLGRTWHSSEGPLSCDARGEDCYVTEQTRRSPSLHLQARLLPPWHVAPNVWALVNINAHAPLVGVGASVGFR